jgi:hypothetical protein
MGSHSRDRRAAPLAQYQARRVGAPAQGKTRPAATLSRVPTEDFFASAQYWAYRLGAFVLLNVLDDPAWLALIFC